MKELLRFLKVILVLHISCAIWFGLFTASVISDTGFFETFIKAALIMPFIFGNALYLGCLAFCTLSTYFILMNREK